jgi:glutamate synthase (NADPH/NADH) large chain
VWLKKGVRYLQTDLIDPRLAAEPFDRDTLALFQKMFNVSPRSATNHPRAGRGRE